MSDDEQELDAFEEEEFEDDYEDESKEAIEKASENDINDQEQPEQPPIVAKLNMAEAEGGNVLIIKAEHAVEMGNEHTVDAVEMFAVEAEAYAQKTYMQSDACIEEAQVDAYATAAAQSMFEGQREANLYDQGRIAETNIQTQSEPRTQGRPVTEDVVMKTQPESKSPSRGPRWKLSMDAEVEDGEEAESEEFNIEHLVSEATETAAFKAEVEADKEEDNDQVFRDLVGSLAQRAAKAIETADVPQLSRQIRGSFQSDLQSHPAVAIEATRARLGLAELLAGAGRHTEARAVVKEARDLLHRVMSWATSFPGTPVVDALRAEAEMLQSLATTIEERVASGADSKLPRSMSSQQFRRTLTFPDQEQTQVQGALPFLTPSYVSHVQPGQQRDTSGSLLGVTDRESYVSSGVHLPSLSVARKGSFAESFGSKEGPRHGGGGSRHRASPGTTSTGPRREKSPKKSGTKSAAKAGWRQAEDQPVDMFKEWLRAKDKDKEARLGALRDQQEVDRKRLQQVHRTTRLLFEIIHDDELKNKKYTNTGHKVVMSNLQSANKSRSDTDLLREARRCGDAPEVLILRRLNRQLYVKPPTPKKAAAPDPKLAAVEGLSLGPIRFTKRDHDMI